MLSVTARCFIKHPYPPVFTVTVLTTTLNTFFKVERRHAKQRERLFNVTAIIFLIIIVKYEFC